MTAFNIVRMRVKPGHEDAFIAAHRAFKQAPFKGFRGGALVKTGDQTFCVVGEWASFKTLANARPLMIGILDGFREHLEDLGNGLGVTDPVAGEMVVRLPASKPAKKAAAKKSAKKTKGKKRR
ncbi:MAG TPA: DUF718 domain-containing protein [Pseudolabrys sp.]|nr:DUF718 domain-containing protein [Pseudolabrys sp.]